MNPQSHFHSAVYLRKATGRAKSDVANKHVSMFLHELSRKICISLNVNVTDRQYTEAVAAEFGHNCCYCERPLENDRAAIEHLDGMNRFRAGLHIPGNVIVSCKKCNNEKRRDDQREKLILADSGWESFLAHDSKNCGGDCKTCAYWRSIWPDETERVERLRRARQRILRFRAAYPASIEWSHNARNLLRAELDKIYRECQTYAVSRIEGSIGTIFSQLTARPRY